jgi:hypothetical protein
MTFKLAQSAETSWHRLRGYNQLPKIITLWLGRRLGIAGAINPWGCHRGSAAAA